MDAEGPVAPAAPRPNPFAFPSDTGFRFAVLILSVLGAGLTIFDLVFLSIPSIQRWFLQSHVTCFRLHGTSGEPENLSRCLADVRLTEAGWAVGSTLLLLLVAALIYWYYPKWKVYRRQLRRLELEDAPDIVAYLEDLCREVQLSRAPMVLWDPLNPAIYGLAMGRLGRYYIVISGGLVTRFYTDRPVFRAVVLHELAHLRNGDVDRTYFTVAVWRAFLIVALGTLLVVQLWYRNTSPFTTATLTLGVVALTVLVYMMRNGVLRAREIYADVRASAWDGPDGALVRVLESLRAPHKRWWRPMLQMHPAPQARRLAIENPGRLYMLSFWDAFAAGVAAGMAVPNLIYLLTLVTQGALASVGTGPWIGSAAAVGLPVAGVLGAGAWREEFTARIGKGSRLRAWHLGVGAGLGLAAGHILALTALVARSSAAGTEVLEQWSTRSIVLSATLTLNVFWFVLLMIGLMLLGGWLSSSARAWLQSDATRRSPRPAFWTNTLIAGGVLGIGTGLILSMRNLSTTTLPLIGQEGIAGYIGLQLWQVWANTDHPLVLPALISLWAFPLLAWFWPRYDPSEADWALLDAHSDPLKPVAFEPFRLRLALMTGIVSGVLFAATLLALYVLGIIHSPGSDQSQALVLYLQLLAFAAASQSVVAAVVSASVAWLGPVHGLFSAFVAGCVMVAGVVGLNFLMLGPGLSLSSAWFMSRQLLTWGALLAIPAAVMASGLAGWIRRTGR